MKTHSLGYTISFNSSGISLKIFSLSFSPTACMHACRSACVYLNTVSVLTYTYSLTFCFLSVLILSFISYLPWFPVIHMLPSSFSVWNTGIIHMCYYDQILFKILGIWTYVLLSCSKFFIYWAVTTALLNITYSNYFIVLSHSDSTLCCVLHCNYLSFVFSCIPQNIIC